MRDPAAFLVLAFAAFAACAAFAAGGCSCGGDDNPFDEAGFGQLCETNGDCKSGLVCVEGLCVRGRLTSNEWPTTEGGVVPQGLLHPDQVVHVCGLATGCVLPIAG